MRDPDHEGSPPHGYLDAFLAVIGGINGVIGGGIFAGI
jgi:hypothetical protein